jgi:protein TonB
MRLMWVGLALLLHTALLFAVPHGAPEAIRFPEPIQVSLLDPAPAQASEPAVPEPLPPAAPPPVKPLKKPKPVPELPPIAKPEMPLSDIPVAEPVMTTPAQTSAESAATTSSSYAPAQNTGASGDSDVQVDARFDAAYLRNPKPVYPGMSRRLREEGKVMLRVFVLSDGNPQEIEVKRSSGSVRLDEAAKAAVNRWRFVPARRGNAAVAAWVVVPIIFKLES